MTFEDELDAMIEDALRAQDEDDDAVEDDHDPDAVEDAHMAQTVADRALKGQYCWTAGTGWMGYQRGCWHATSEAAVTEAVRNFLIKLHGHAARTGANVRRLKELSSLLSASRIRSLVFLVRGILRVENAAFDRHPDLLNVGNGVVHLATGELSAHDPSLYLTKITSVPYYAGSASPDWAEALAALPEEVRPWLQLRIGQSATGHPTPDDLLCVLQGGGSNGKTTVTGTVSKVLGEHAVVVPERLLMANPSDHPTELMTLRGARFAMIEETPEARHLSVKRLKDTVGTPTMTARLIRQDNVTWETTHTLFLTTNYLPRIDETDHGTWRRLALVRFPYTFRSAGEAGEGTGVSERPGKTGLRERLRDGRQGQHEAVLAWIVAGAEQWYSGDRAMPRLPLVVITDTFAWRAQADLILGFISDRLVFDPDAHVISTELFAVFNDWIAHRGHRSWSDQTFTGRFQEHGAVASANAVKKRLKYRPGLSRASLYLSPPTGQYMAYVGVRFKTEDDDADGDFERGVQGLQGSSDNLTYGSHSRDTGQPLQPLQRPSLGLAGLAGRCAACEAHVASQGHLATCPEGST
jgi:putative DNA primase/helicase